MVAKPVVDQAAIDRAVKQMTDSKRRTHEQQMRPIKAFLAFVRKTGPNELSQTVIPDRKIQRTAQLAPKRSVLTGDITIPKGERAILTACAQFWMKGTNE